jgi:hypothetical protein
VPSRHPQQRFDTAIANLDNSWKSRDVVVAHIDREALLRHSYGLERGPTLCGDG